MTDIPGRAFPAIKNPEDFLDLKDIFRQYDFELWKLLTIPINILGSDEIDRMWSWESLNLLEVNTLRELARSRNVFSDTDKKDLLVMAVYNSQRIPVVFATPDPAYATQPNTTGRKETSKVANTVRFPIITITRLGINEDPERFSKPHIRKIAWSSDKNSVMQGQKPIPLFYRWQVEVQAKLRTHMNLISQMFIRILKTNPLRVEVEHGDPWGLIPAYYDAEESYDDQSEYESDAESAQRILRQIHNVRAAGWLPLTTYATPTVRLYSREFVDSLDDNKLLDSDTITLGNAGRLEDDMIVTPPFDFPIG